MKVAHLLRKYNPAEWSGTETAVHRLMTGLKASGASSVVYAPQTAETFEDDPYRRDGHPVKRYRAFVPVLGISQAQRRQMISNGGNLMSLDLIVQLAREERLSVIHSHAVNRIGAIGLTVARRRRLPFVVTIHGGILDLPQSVKDSLAAPLKGGFEWGKVFGALLGSRTLLARADAILTCNSKEADLLRERHPDRRIIVQPHSVPSRSFERDHRAAAEEAFPRIRNARVALCVGRLDPVKNQGWLIEQLPSVLRRHSDAVLVLAGPCTDESYGKLLKKEIRRLGLEDRTLITGGLPSGDPRLIGLMQRAALGVVPSHSETFGIVILEFWAAQTPVVSTRTSGALGLIEEGQNGWLFDLSAPETFHSAVDAALAQPEKARALAERGRRQVVREHDVDVIAKRVRDLYDELIERKRVCTK